eukprot:GHUV01041584.1.p2 GENE.GHUV01041584.1~~GHUV01041584.1.p2  ORF type:complete len:114 (-),score=12.40 GHUV01041584.1:136-477(-)
MTVTLTFIAGGCRSTVWQKTMLQLCTHCGNGRPSCDAGARNLCIGPASVVVQQPINHIQLEGAMEAFAVQLMLTMCSRAVARHITHKVVLGCAGALLLIWYQGCICRSRQARR